MMAALARLWVAFLLAALCASALALAAALLHEMGFRPMRRLAAANEGRSLAKWLAVAGTGCKPYRRSPGGASDHGSGRAVAPRPPLSPEARAVHDAVRALYRDFYIRRGWTGR